MSDFWALLIIPIIVTVMGLVIEYWIFQPLKKNQENSREKSQGNLPQPKDDTPKKTITNIPQQLQQKPSNPSYPLIVGRPKNYLYPNTFYESEPEIIETHSIEPEKPKPPVTAIFYSLAILFISSTSALSAAILFRIISDWYQSYKPTSLLSILANLIAESDFVFVIMLIIMIPIATAAAFFVDNAYDKESTKTATRFSIVAVIGFLSAITGCVAVPILIIGIVLYLSKDLPPARTFGSSSGS